MKKCKVCGECIIDDNHEIVWIFCSSCIGSSHPTLPINVLRTPYRWKEGTTAQIAHYVQGFKDNTASHPPQKIEDPDLKIWYSIGWNIANTYYPKEI
jgi:hypothetical protein